MRAYRAKKFKDLIFTSMIPPWFEKQALVLSDQDLATEHSFRSESSDMTLPGYDLLGDRSLLITALPGHAEGHLGALVAGSHLLAGDACWGKDLITCSSSMRWIGRRIQHNYPAYCENLRALEKLQDQGITLCFSHDTYSQPLPYSLKSGTGVSVANKSSASPSPAGCAHELNWLGN